MVAVSHLFGLLLVSNVRSDPGNAQSPRTELTIVPFVGGDSDVGFGGGYMASLGRLSPEYEPFLYRIESAGSITFKETQNGVEIPYLDTYLLLDLPHVIKDKLRVELRASFTRESTLKYYGLGNQAPIAKDRDSADPFYEHLRIHPTFQGQAEYDLSFGLVLNWGFEYTQNWLEIPPKGKLALDMREGTAAEQRLLRAGGTHALLKLSYGLAWDSREDEQAPGSGQHHSLSLEVSPGGPHFMPHRWAKLNGTFRFYETLILKRLIFASRIVSDWIFGEPPFYELPRYDDTNALGGTKGVRGVPAQRYYGKIKLFGNAELRSELFDFEFLSKTNTLGIVGFFDAGRLWADYAEKPDLDGSGIGLHYGAGGGIRVRAGESFVLRFDVAWSPNAQPLAAYLASGEVF